MILKAAFAKYQAHFIFKAFKSVRWVFEPVYTIVKLSSEDRLFENPNRPFLCLDLLRNLPGGVEQVGWVFGAPSGTHHGNILSRIIPNSWQRSRKGNTALTIAYRTEVVA